MDLDDGSLNDIAYQIYVDCLRKATYPETIAEQLRQIRAAVQERCALRCEAEENDFADASNDAEDAGDDDAAMEFAERSLGAGRCAARIRSLKWT